MSKRYLVTLTPEERRGLTEMVRVGRRSALTLTRARILLKADQAAGVRPGGPARGLEPALGRKPQDRPSRERKFDGAAEARLIALACSAPPAGRARWTLKLLADKLVELELFASVSDETVRRVLKKTS